MKPRFFPVVLGLTWASVGSFAVNAAAEPVSELQAPTPQPQPSSKTPSSETTGQPVELQPNELTRLHPDQEIWVDPKRKRVVVGGQVCLREGLLEMFACPRATKEHESIVAVNSRASLVHTALLSVGAKPGHPVRYDPIYQPAEGQAIEIEVIWRDKQGQVKRRRAQDMVRHVKRGKPMSLDWIFAGSGFWKDEETGEKFYQAEGGELICLSNFSTATLDLPVESPRDNADLVYEAFTENIPPVGTKVRLILAAKKGKASD